MYSNGQLAGKRMSRLLMVIATTMMTGTAAADTFDYDASFRARHQQVNDQSLKNASATTLLARLEASLKATDALTFFAQYDHVWALDTDSYNSIAQFNDHAPIPDPPGGELNQFNLNWQFAANWSAKLGRQAISFDNERHIGSAAYWQNEQTFDAAALAYQNGFGWQFSYSYVDKVQRIYGDDSRSQLPRSDPRYQDNPIRPSSELGEHQHHSHLFNVSQRVNANLKVSSFAYLLDNHSASQFSSDTLGVHFEGALKPNQFKYNYTVELAWQKEAANNPVNYQTWYLLTELGLQYQSHRIDVGYEYLGDDDGVGFQTSLGTNHKFLGWADVFSRYDELGGMRDIYVAYAGRKAKIRWKIVAHSFESLVTRQKLGDELDLELAWRYSRKWEFKLIAAYYRAREQADYSVINDTEMNNADISTWEVSAAYNF